MLKAVPALFASAGAALLGGSVGFFLLIALRGPGLYRDPMFVPGFALRCTTLALLIYVLVPVIILSASAAARSEGLTIRTCIAVPVCWLLLIFLLWSYKPWRYYGRFPWWAFNRDFVQSLPPMLATGWLFWRTQRSSGSANCESRDDR